MVEYKELRRLETLIPTSKQQLIPYMETNFFTYMSYYARQLPDMRVIDDPNILIVDSTFASDTFNYICRARFETDVEREIERAVSYFKSRNLPYAWWVTPNSYPHNLGTYLNRCGLQQTEQDLGMIADLNDLPVLKTPEKLEIRRVNSIEGMHDFAFVVSSVFDPPDPVVRSFYENVSNVILTEDCPLQLFVAYFDGKPVSTSALFIDLQIAGIYSVTTLQTFRRHGFGTAVTLTALKFARHEGLKFAALQASEDGKHIYEALGFEGCCDFFVYQ